MNRINKKNPLLYFFAPYLAFAAIWFSLIVIYEKGQLHLMLNSYHTPFLDTFFTYVTELGATVPPVVAVIYLFYKMSGSFYILLSLLINVLLTNGLKLLFRVPRPKAFFAENHPDIALRFVEGMRIYETNGFPSGHTSAVFVLMTCIALMSQNRWISLVCCLLAALGAYSRVYLSQHFAEDILLGSAVGISVALAMYPLYMKSKNYAWMNRPLYSTLKKINR